MTTLKNIIVLLLIFKMVKYEKSRKKYKMYEKYLDDKTYKKNESWIVIMNEKHNNLVTKCAN